MYMASPLLKEKLPRLPWPGVANHKSRTVGLTHGAPGYKGTRQEHGARIQQKADLDKQIAKTQKDMGKARARLGELRPKVGPSAHCPSALGHWTIKLILIPTLRPWGSGKRHST